MPSPRFNAVKPAAALDYVRELLQSQVVERDLIGRSGGPQQALQLQLLHKQQLGALWREVNQLHPADLAYVLENLPREDRRLVWSQVESALSGAVLLEVNDAVRSNLLQWMGQQEVLTVADHLDNEEIADLVPDLPAEVVPGLMDRLSPNDRHRVQAVLAFPADTVGALMDLDVPAVRADVTLDVVLRWLRRRGNLPNALDILPVVDRQGELQGTLHLHSLLIEPGERLVSESMQPDPVSFHTGDAAGDAAHAFERYDLIAAPVTNLHGTLVGLLKVEAVLDHIQESGQRDLLNQAGLRGEEDLFAPVWQSARNRGLWLGLNLLTAFAASRVIEHFEYVIAQVVALAVLMPIVAAVGGNSGNQTLALVIRGYASGEIADDAFRRLLLKEGGVGLVNGLLWGGLMALGTLLLYQDLLLALIMLVAMALNMSCATLAGVLIPAGLLKLGKNPAYGSSILVTGITDSLGFLIFLGLAASLLVGAG